jgi:hypothetical protein
MCAGLLVLGGELAVDVNAGKIEEGVLVVWSVVGLDLVVVAGNAIVASIHNGLDGIQIGEELLALVQTLLAAGKVAEQQLGVGERRQRQRICLGGGAGRRRCSGCIVSRLHGVRGDEVRVDALEETEGKIRLRVLAADTAGNLDELEGVDPALDGGDEPVVS